MEVHWHAGFFQLFKGIKVVSAPRVGVFEFCLQPFYVFAVFGITHQHAAGKTDYVSVNKLRDRSFRYLCLFQAGYKAVHKVNLGNYVP